MKKNLITILVIVGALALIVFTLMKNKKENQAKIDVVAEKNASIAVKIDVVKTENIALDFSANGTFEPTQQLTFSAEKSGKVIRVLAKEGDIVREGQVLAIVRSDVINVNAQTAEAAYENALTDYKRFENAYKTGGVTKQQLDQSRLSMINAQSNLKQAKINVGDTQIKSPISGVINKKMIEVGSILAGMPPTNMFEIVNISKLKLKVTVNENQVSKLKVGNIINVTSSVYPDKIFNGKITFIAAKADTSLNFPIEIEIANNINNDLRAGMYGTAQFDSKQQKQNLMIVPRNAFVGSVSSNQIFVNNNGTAELKTVITGRIIGDKVEILKGLSDGDQVITTGQINLNNGSKIEIIK
ncbi:efflux RND transporter periplasmic adaptor subunit [Flavobacterium sp. SUN046]|uniref:efflux RND transporter periplasmic adaptor subunit n=1 Tax=Flavobacterium sp. SUN046 TaxID=3002440 RepID=UPI002DB8DF52|nr:efflux RND transporter periplasmic adaptor subunit [Flavobacterium sp. SUN046]MEC4047880.1 efflux RND transporter periplasmic adaptor subunit [Flavobacterium sp. SUN046]